MQPDTTRHTRFCYMPEGPCYFLTCDCQCHGPIRPATLQAARERRREPETTSWGLEAGTANGIASLLWLTLLLGAVIYLIAGVLAR